MVYIKNNGRYAISFELTLGAKIEKVVLDKVRIYRDTGNIATNGITALEDSKFKHLEMIPEFKAMLDKGTLSIVKESELNTTEDSKDKEIAELKEKLANADTAKVEKELEAKDKEIASLKAQLEAKANKTKANKTKAENESEGF